VSGRRTSVVAVTEQPPGAAPLTRDRRLRLEALRYAVNEESASYLAIMRTFTGAVTGLLSAAGRSWSRHLNQVAITWARE
jgi:hypothetical protein